MSSESSDELYNYLLDELKNIKKEQFKSKVDEEYAQAYEYSQKLEHRIIITQNAINLLPLYQKPKHEAEEARNNYVSELETLMSYRRNLPSKNEILKDLMKKWFVAKTIQKTKELYDNNNEISLIVGDERITKHDYESWIETDPWSDHDIDNREDNLKYALGRFFDANYQIGQGKSKKQPTCTPTSKRIVLPSDKRIRIVYAGARGKQYIVKGGKYVPLPKNAQVCKKAKN